MTEVTEVMRSGRLIPSLTLHFVRAGAVTGTGTLRNVLIVSYGRADDSEQGNCTSKLSKEAEEIALVPASDVEFASQ